MSTPAPTTITAAPATPAATAPVTPTPLYDNTPADPAAAPAAAATPAEPAKVEPPATPTATAAAPTDPAKVEPDPAKPADAPAEPKFELKLPDGSLLDAAHVEKVVSFAKEKNLSPEQAQAVLARESDAVKAYSEVQQNALKERQTVWKSESIADKEIGGDNLAKNVELAHRALKHFGGDKLMQELEATKYGDHPEVVRVFARIGKAMGEDKFVNSGNTAATKKSMAETFYPTKTE